MSSQSDRFECCWQPSRALLAVYIGAQLLALISIFLLDIAHWAQIMGLLLCLGHGFCVLRNSILLNHESAFTGLRRDATGWYLWCEAGGWLPVQLRPDSLALPHVVVLRFRLVKGNWLDRLWTRSLCIPSDSMNREQHRRLRLRLKFSRKRWAMPE